MMMIFKMTLSYHNIKNTPPFHPRKMWVTIILLSLCLLYLSIPAFAETLKIKDGDSFVLNGVEIRLWGIDAPEYNQQCQTSGKSYPCGREAMAFFENLLTPLPFILCKKKTGAKKETRKVAQCFIEDTDIAEILVLNGHAIDDKYFSTGHYKLAEEQAKTQKRGIWRGKFMIPREWRKIHH